MLRLDDVVFIVRAYARQTMSDTTLWVQMGVEDQAYKNRHGVSHAEVVPALLRVSPHPSDY
jgi:hypothetical protein